MAIKEEDFVKDLKFDCRRELLNFSRPELVKVLQYMTKSAGKKDLVDLIMKHPIKQLFTNLEKKDKKILLDILHEPKEEKQLRHSVADYFKSKYPLIDYEVPIPTAGRKRDIDVVCAKLGWRKIIAAVELKIERSRGAIDKSFAQARDYEKFADYAYVAFSPLLYWKYGDVIKEKMKRNKSINVLVASKVGVTPIIEGRMSDSVKDASKKSLIEELEKRK